MLMHRENPEQWMGNCPSNQILDQLIKILTALNKFEMGHRRNLSPVRCDALVDAKVAKLRK